MPTHGMKRKKAAKAAPPGLAAPPLAVRSEPLKRAGLVFFSLGAERACILPNANDFFWTARGFGFGFGFGGAFLATGLGFGLGFGGAFLATGFGFGFEAAFLITFFTGFLITFFTTAFFTTAFFTTAFFFGAAFAAMTTGEAEREIASVVRREAGAAFGTGANASVETNRAAARQKSRSIGEAMAFGSDTDEVLRAR